MINMNRKLLSRNNPLTSSNRKCYQNHMMSMHGLNFQKSIVNLQSTIAITCTDEMLKGLALHM